MNAHDQPFNMKNLFRYIRFDLVSEQIDNKHFEDLARHPNLDALLSVGIYIQTRLSAYVPRKHV